jgi:hypothetical protein
MLEESWKMEEEDNINAMHFETNLTCEVRSNRIFVLARRFESDITTTRLSVDGTVDENRPPGFESNSLPVEVETS